VLSIGATKKSPHPERAHQRDVEGRLVRLQPRRIATVASFDCSLRSRSG
jgi:hypothetical protein